MSATNSTAITGQSSNVGPLVAAVALAAIVAVGAVGLAMNHVGTSSTTNQAKAGPAVVTESTMSGPRSVAQKGLVAHQAAISATKDADASVSLIADQAAIAATKDADASVSLGTGIATPYSGSEFGAQYDAWLAAQNAAAANDFPDYFERINGSNAGSTLYGGSDFAGQYGAWLAAQNAAAANDFPDYFQRINGSNAVTSPFVDGRISAQHRLPQ